VTLRGLVKAAAAETLDRTGAARAARRLRSRSSRAVILGYHRVVEDAGHGGGSIPAMVVSTRTLERQLDCVGRDHLFVSLDELAERLESGRPADRPLAAVTFDDGYRDVHEHALPLLRRKGIPAAIFVVTGLVGSARLQRHDRLYLALARLLARGDGEARLARIAGALGPRAAGLAAGAAGRGPGVFAVSRAFIETLAAPDLERALRAIESDAGPAPDLPELRSLTWDMVREMHRAGVTIGSHTASHVLLTHEDRDRVRAELRASREALEEELGAPVRHFAYPDGSFDAAAVDEVAAAGYRYAYTACGHRDRRHPNLTVPRRVLWENSSRGAGGRFSAAVMRCGVHGVFDVVGGCRRDHGRPARAGRAASA
jgi:peptidoglycan/xylan/chitin deacetylase (PgdA/CDA1 family)